MCFSFIYKIESIEKRLVAPEQRDGFTIKRNFIETNDNLKVFEINSFYDQRFEENCSFLTVRNGYKDYLKCVPESFLSNKSSAYVSVRFMEEGCKKKLAFISSSYKPKVAIEILNDDKWVTGNIYRFYEIGKYYKEYYTYMLFENGDCVKFKREDDYDYFEISNPFKDSFVTKTN